MPKINFTRLIIGILIAALLTYALLTQIHPSDVAAAFSRLSARWLLLAFLVLVAMDLLKAWRFSHLLQGQLTPAALLPVVLVHNIFIAFMPSRTGELSYLYLLNRKHGIAVSKGLSSLVIARVLDVIIILLLICAMMFVSARQLPGVVSRLLPLSAAGIAFLLAVFGLLVYRTPWIESLLNRLFLRLKWYEKKYLGAAARRIIETLKAFEQGYGPGRLVYFAAVTSLIWLLTFAFEFVLYRGLGLRISYAQFLVASFFPILTNIIPVQSVGAIGTYEATISGGFVLLGFRLSDVIPLTFTVHVVQLAGTATLGLVGWLWYRSLPQRGQAAQNLVS